MSLPFNYEHKQLIGQRSTCAVVCGQCDAGSTLLSICRLKRTGAKHFFSPPQRKTDATDYIRLEDNMQQIFSTGQVAKRLGLQAYRIGYAHSTGQLAEPAFRFLDKRVYTEADVHRVAEHFGIDLDGTDVKEEVS